jgi:hypothetical protein
MDELAGHPHASRRVEEMAPLNERISDRTAAHCLVEPRKLILSPRNGWEKGLKMPIFNLVSPC